MYSKFQRDSWRGVGDHPACFAVIWQCLCGFVYSVCSVVGYMRSSCSWHQCLHWSSWHTH